MSAEAGEVCAECDGRGYLIAQPNERSTTHGCPVCAGSGIVLPIDPEMNATNSEIKNHE